jgi:hypothetical protein
MTLQDLWTVHGLEVLDSTFNARKIPEVIEHTFRSHRKLERFLWDLDDITFV